MLISVHFFLSYNSTLLRSSHQRFFFLFLSEFLLWLSPFSTSYTFVCSKEDAWNFAQIK